MDANAPFSVSFWHARLNNLPLLQFYTQSTHTPHTHSPHSILCTVVSLPLLMGNNDCVSTTRPPRAAPFRVSLSPFPSWCCTFRTRPLCNCVCVTLRESHIPYTSNEHAWFVVTFVKFIYFAFWHTFRQHFIHCAGACCSFRMAYVASTLFGLFIFFIFYLWLEQHSLGVCCYLTVSLR